MVTRLLFFWLTIGTLSAQQIDVMTYNIRYDNPGDGINQWSSRKEKVFALIKKYDPDIFGVQEALHHQLTDIQNNCNGYKFIGVGRDDGKEKGEYSAIFYRSSRFDVIDQNTFWLSETPQTPGRKIWDAAITRVATWEK
jgi:endonuclease/exonuclease/phosphatase family metal-dependent hydrolase